MEIKSFKTGRFYDGQPQNVKYTHQENSVYFIDLARGIDGFIDLLLPCLASEKEILEAYDSGAYRGAMNKSEIDLSRAVAKQLNNEKPVVAYHEGGSLFAGDEAYYSPGWYLFEKGEARIVTVLEPFTNNALEV